MVLKNNPWILTFCRAENKLLNWCGPFFLIGLMYGRAAIFEIKGPYYQTNSLIIEQTLHTADILPLLPLPKRPKNTNMISLILVGREWEICLLSLRNICGENGLSAIYVFFERVKRGHGIFACHILEYESFCLPRSYNLKARYRKLWMKYYLKLPIFQCTNSINLIFKL